jgi:tetratricopeptide (TPR) repeat protein
MAETDEVDTMFQDAVDALRQGDRARAKDILTRLLKTEQNNATYWIWMSAAVDTTKERIYCLQTALKLEPENDTAKRGLILLGALAPDEKVRPFPLNRPRAWEEKLLLAHEQPKQGGVRIALSNPAMRLAGVLVVGIAVCGFAVYGLMMPRRNNFRPPNTNTPGPSPTFTATPTFVNATGRAPATRVGPTPLAVLFHVSYTATPLYVNTPRPLESRDQYRQAKFAYEAGDWDSFIQNMKQVQKIEPQSPDVLYYIGEGYRFKGQYKDAIDFYAQALKLDPDFGAAYLGLARARLLQDSNADVTQLLDAAQNADPNFGEIYLERANYYINHNQPERALTDLDAAAQRMPGSGLVQLGYARAYYLLGDEVKALQTAQKANQIDKTLLPIYYIEGQIFMARANYSDAIKSLETYLIYVEDGGAQALLGQAYAVTGSYEAAIDTLTTAFSLDPTQRQIYIYRGLSYLETNRIDLAASDLRNAIDYYPDSFDAHLGLIRIHFIQEHFGDAYLQTETTKPLAKTDHQKALLYYWTGLVQEKRGDRQLANEAWQALLALPENAMTTQMRNDAEVHLHAVVTPTSTPKPGGTRTPTPTKTP